MLSNIATDFAGLRDAVPHRDATGEIAFNMKSGVLLQTLPDLQQTCLVGAMIKGQGLVMAINVQHVRSAFYTQQRL